MQNQKTFNSENEIKISSEDYWEIGKRMALHHAVFQKMWELGKPVFSNSIERACVMFDKTGNCVLFLFNPEFWSTLNIEKKIFVIAHECLHVVLSHGIRLKDSDKESQNDNNKAADISINHLLVKEFGMDRALIDPKNEYCWVDTVFPEISISDDKNFEYYYNILKDKSKSNSNKNKQQIVDDHSELEKISSEDKEKILDEISKKLSEEEKDSFAKTLKDFEEKEESNKTGKNRGDSKGSLVMWMSGEKIKKKKKWETVIKNWAKKYLTNSYKQMDQWIRSSRRISNLSEDLIIPSEMETEEKEEEKQRIEVWFFLDTSGSCEGYAQRFWKAACSLPEKKFDIKLFCFDTEVYKVNSKDRKLYGFGGTSFSIIEEYIINNIKNKKYPKAVFLITDGYGDEVFPQKPENWYVFLTRGGTPDCFPQGTRIFKLEDFE